MTKKEEDYILDSIEQIRIETHQNNVMLRQIIKVINTYISHHNTENENDFVRNVFANLISSGLDINKLFRRR